MVTTVVIQGMAYIMALIGTAMEAVMELHFVTMEFVGVIQVTFLLMVLAGIIELIMRNKKKIYAARQVFFRLYHVHIIIHARHLT